MAATDSSPLGSAILLAALALPGVASADAAPEQATLAIKYLDYQDKQPGLDRTGVRSPAVELVLPLSGQWAIHANAVHDSVSGASPRYHSAISSASRQVEERNALDLQVSRYFERGSLSASAGRSSENDYVSRYYSLQGSLSSQDQNSTWQFGLAVANDDINSTNKVAKDEHKRSTEILLGMSQVLSKQDLAQVVFTHSRGRGYFSDPYKSLDNRPRERDQYTLTLRWHHHFEASDTTLRYSYRYYSDSFGIRAHTFGKELVWPLADGWTIIPSGRYHTQSKANFYFDPVYDKRFGAPFPPGYQFSSPPISSADQRLSAFGAITLGLKVEKQFAQNWRADAKLEFYQQRASWRWFGSGSPGLAKFSARSLQLGIAKSW